MANVCIILLDLFQFIQFVDNDQTGVAIESYNITVLSLYTRLGTVVQTCC